MIGTVVSSVVVTALLCEVVIPLFLVCVFEH